MIDEKYYFSNTKLNEVYPTLWHGFLEYIKIINIVPNPITYNEIDNILVEICEINFYFHHDINDNKLYFSLDRDENYYAHQFEKQIKNIIKSFETHFKIKITNGEFYANEIKHNGSQYRYLISLSNDDKIIVKKKTLNWEVSCKKTDDITQKIAKINI